MSMRELFCPDPLAGFEKMGGFQIFFLPKIKMFLLITWKEQAICLQMLQAVVITLPLLNFLEEYLLPHSKTDFNDINFLALYWKCACVGPIFFQDAFTKCVHIRRFLDM